MRKFFGTDGIRGRFGHDLTPELALALGRAVCDYLIVECSCQEPRVLVIRDPRASGFILESSFAAGIAANGGQVFLAGILPTPAAPLLLGKYQFDLAAVISASHNPYYDNGIKIFAAGGDKLSDESEVQVEAFLADYLSQNAQRQVTQADRVGEIEKLRGAREDYLRILQQRFSELDLSHLHIMLDCANGATSPVAYEIFERLGAKVTVIANQPDGYNINEGCGSTQPDFLISHLKHDSSVDVGFTFDGDGDRVLAIDRNGKLVDGDEIIALAARALARENRLVGGGVAVTVMANYGFHQAMREDGIEVAVTDVGDRYVLQALRERNWVFGGEQSGHIIELGFAPSGDGIATALLVLEALAGADLADRKTFTRLPQYLRNVRVEDKHQVMQDVSLRNAITQQEQELHGRGRILVRASGTEQLVRVMVEAPDDAEAQAICDELVAVIERL